MSQERKRRRKPPPERLNPSTTDACDALVDEGFKIGTGGISTKIDRYEQAKESCLDIRNYLTKNLNIFDPSHSETLSKAIRRLDLCATYLQFRHYYTIDELRLIKIFCCKQYMLCPTCAVRRSSVYLREYIKRWDVISAEDDSLKYSMVTFTIRHTKKDMLLPLYERIRGVWHTVNKQIQNFRMRGGNSVFGKFLGWFGSYEVTNIGKNGWHPHLHLLVVHREELTEEEIVAEWFRLTGDSDQVKVSKALNPDNPIKDFAEVIKYNLKFTKMSKKNIVEAFLTLKGKRMIFNGGLLRGVEVPDDLTDEQLKDLPYIDFFYQYINGSGYNLKHYKHNEPLSESYEEIESSYDPKLKRYVEPPSVPVSEVAFDVGYDMGKNHIELENFIPGTSSVFAAMPRQKKPRRVSRPKRERWTYTRAAKAYYSERGRDDCS